MFKLMQTKAYGSSVSSFLTRGHSRYSFLSGRTLHKVHSGNLHCSQPRGPLDPVFFRSSTATSLLDFIRSRAKPARPDGWANIWYNVHKNMVQYTRETSFFFPLHRFNISLRKSQIFCMSLVLLSSIQWRRSYEGFLFVLRFTSPYSTKQTKILSLHGGFSFHQLSMLSN